MAELGECQYIFTENRDGVIGTDAGALTASVTFSFVNDGNGYTDRFRRISLPIG